MKTSGKVWILFDSTTKIQTKPMSVVQAQVALLAVPPNQYKKMFIWTPGWAEWISLKEFFDSEQTYFVFEQPPTPMKPVNPRGDTSYNEDFTKSSPLLVKSDIKYTEILSSDPNRYMDNAYYHQKDFNGHDLDLIKIKRAKKASSVKNDPEPEAPETDSDERRSSTRHNFKIEVVLVSKNRSFRTFSANISLGGTLLEDPMPREFFNDSFDLILVNPFERDPSKARLLFKAKVVGDMSNPRRLMFLEQETDMTLRLDALLKAYVQYQKITAAS